MKKFVGLSLFAFSLFLSVPGCGTPEPSNVASEAELSAVEQYEAALKAEEEAMNAAPPSDL